MVQKPSISFLLGAGFSKPAGYPLASEINGQLRRLKASDISIHSSLQAWFNHGVPGPNDWFDGVKERKFAERLILHYVDVVIPSQEFHYERFYDWFKELRGGGSLDVGVEALAKECGGVAADLLLEFGLMFENLLASLFNFHINSAKGFQHPISPYYKFVELVKLLGQMRVLHFHTLNHDLLFERLCCLDPLAGGVADGFDHLGSPYYGRIDQELSPDGLGCRLSGVVRLPCFAGKFDARINLYKLHGSIDQFLISDTVKLPAGVEHGMILREVTQGDSCRYEAVHLPAHPAFLSGVESKKAQYGKTCYSECVFDRFEGNLTRSSILISIGYGFGDDGINDRIKKFYLGRSSARVLVVDITRPPRLNEFEGSYDFFDGGVVDFDLGKLLACAIES